MKRFMALALTLALLSMAVGALAEGFSFRNDITWSSTLEDVQAAESGNEIEMKEASNDNGDVFIQIKIDDVTAAGAKANLYYVFFKGEFMFCSYEFVQGDITLKTLQKALTRKYGDAAQLDSDYPGSILAAYWSEELELEGDTVCWKLEDGTLIVLNGNSDFATITYFNGACIQELSEVFAAVAEEEVINTDGL